MPAAQESGDEIVHDLMLPDDAAADLLQQRAPRARQ
jgi:hypothetical protein